MAKKRSTETPPADEPQSDKPDKDLLTRWLGELREAREHTRHWHDRAKRIVQRFSDERDGDERSGRHMNIFWSNVKTLEPALYARQPKPIVVRRYDMDDPLVRLGSTMLERVLAYQMDEGEFDEAIKLCRSDYLIAGQGTVWVRYDPTLGPEKTPKLPVTATEDGRYLNPQGQGFLEPGMVQEEEGQPFMQGEPYQPLEYERVCVDFVSYVDFLCDPAPTWARVQWVAKREYLTRTELRKYFPKIADEIPVRKRERDIEDDNRTKNDYYGTAEIWEIWDRQRKQIIWLCPDYKDGILKQQKDVLNLADFFPCPQPVWATLKPGTVIPLPDYAMYQDQAAEIDHLTTRITLLLDAMRVAGVYNAGVKELGTLLDSTAGNVLVSCDQWAVLAQSGGIKGQMDFLPLNDVAVAIRTLAEARQIIKQDLFEVTGISDIVRGQGNAGETATAQGIKSRFAALRLEERQNDIARFCRDTIEIMGEIVCNQFQPETILMQGGQQKHPQAQQAIELLKSGAMRRFRIDIETDSTIAQDQEQEKAARVEFLTAVSGFVEKTLPLAMQVPQIQPALLQMLMFGVRGFRTGRDLEEIIEQSIQQLQQQPAQPPPDPEAEKAKMEMEMKKAELGMKQAEMQQNAQSEAMRAQQDAQATAQKAQLEVTIAQMRANLEAQLAQRKMALEERQANAEIRRDDAVALAEQRRKLREAAVNAEIRRKQAENGNGAK